MTTEERHRVFITVKHDDDEVYSECSINEVTQDEIYLLMPELIKNVSAWQKDCVKDRIEQIQNPAYTYQQTQLPTVEDDE